MVQVASSALGAFLATWLWQSLIRVPKFHITNGNSNSPLLCMMSWQGASLPGRVTSVELVAKGGGLGECAMDLFTPNNGGLAAQMQKPGAIPFSWQPLFDAGDEPHWIDGAKSVREVCSELFGERKRGRDEELQTTSAGRWARRNDVVYPEDSEVDKVEEAARRLAGSLCRRAIYLRVGLNVPGLGGGSVQRKVKCRLPGDFSLMNAARYAVWTELRSRVGNQ